MRDDKHLPRRFVVVAIIVGVLVALPLPLLSFGLISSPCVPGAQVATLSDAFTPWVITDTPVHGTATGYITVVNGTTTSRTGWHIAQNGSVAGWFELENWTIFTNVPPPDSLTRCTTDFVALAHDNGITVIRSVPANPAPVNFSNDSQAPTQTGSNSTDTPIVYYDAGFHTTTQTLSACGGGEAVANVSSDSEHMGLGFEYQGAWHILDVTLHVQTEVSYEFMGNGGTWAIDNLSAPGGPGWGWSFSYLGAC
jgi:hypothetical protein